MHKLFKSFILIISISFIVASCLSQNDVPTNSSTNTISPTKTKIIITIKPSLTNTPVLTETPSATLTLESTPTPSEIPPTPDKLSETGPWIVYYGTWNDQGLEPFYISNLDGGGKTKLFEIRTHTNLGVRIPVLSPNQAFLSCQSMKDLDDQMGLEKEIVVYQLPNQGIMARIPAVDPSISQSLRDIGNPGAPEYMYSDESTAISASGNMLWSPDSRYLAYTAVVDGPTSDVYVFDTETLETKRLTSGSTQATLMAWSPDSRWIVHYSWNKGEEGMDGRALPAVNTIWAVEVESGAIKLLENVEWESIDEYILGWASQDIFVTVSNEGNGIGVPRSHVRKINIASNVSSMLYENEIESVAFDPKTQSLAFTNGVFSNENPGLYLFSSNFSLEKIDDREWDYVHLLEEVGWFVTESWGENRNLIFTPQGSLIEQFPDEKNGIPEVSPNGEVFAFIGKNNIGEKGIRVYDKNGEIIEVVLPELIFTEGNYYWRTDSSGFIFVEHTGGIYDYEKVFEYSIKENTLIQWLENPDDNFDMQYIVGIIFP